MTLSRLPVRLLLALVGGLCLIAGVLSTVAVFAGDHGVAATLDADAMLAHLDATVADVTDPA